jgi:hypothetical protein
LNAKKIGRIALGVAALLLVASAARAVVLERRGQLSAAGNGLDVLQFRGEGSFAGFGLAIVEQRAIVSTSGEGHITPLPRGRALLEGFGRVSIPASTSARASRSPVRGCACAPGAPAPSS